MLEVAAAQTGFIGARMTGGGFGGCTINLVECAAVSDFRRKVAAAYSSKTGLTPEIFVSPATGAALHIVVLENKPPGAQISCHAFPPTQQSPLPPFHSPPP